jgi:hypothetical protein
MRCYQIRSIISGVLFSTFLLIHVSCAMTVNFGPFISEELMRRNLDPVFKNQQIDYRLESKCQKQLTVKLVNADKNRQDPIFLLKNSKSFIVQPKDMVSDIMEYMRKKFELCGVIVVDTSDKELRISLENLYYPEGTFITHSSVQIKVEAPQINYSHVYEGSDASGGSHRAGAFAIHHAVWGVIEDPVIQDYIQCR